MRGGKVVVQLYSILRKTRAKPGDNGSILWSKRQGHSEKERD
jgi:hypothetical protein